MFLFCLVLLFYSFLFTFLFLVLNFLVFICLQKGIMFFLRQLLITEKYHRFTSAHANYMNHDILLPAIWVLMNFKNFVYEMCI